MIKDSIIKLNEQLNVHLNRCRLVEDKLDELVAGNIFITTDGVEHIASCAEKPGYSDLLIWGDKGNKYLAKDILRWVSPQYEVPK